MTDRFISIMIDNQEYSFNVNGLMNLIADKKWNYWEEYHTEPKYIKLPLWVFESLKQYSHQLIGFTPDDINTFLGLSICPTVSITDFDEIEIF